jgi:hypothetical protein
LLIMFHIFLSFVINLIEMRYAIDSNWILCILIFTNLINWDLTTLLTFLDYHVSHISNDYSLDVMDPSFDMKWWSEQVWPMGSKWSRLNSYHTRNEAWIRASDGNERVKNDTFLVLTWQNRA